MIEIDITINLVYVYFEFNEVHIIRLYFGFIVFDHRCIFDSYSFYTSTSRNTIVCTYIKLFYSFNF